MNSLLALIFSFGSSEAPPAQISADMMFLGKPAQLEAFCSRKFVFAEEMQACKEKALIIGLEKTEACSNFSKMSVDREMCLASAGEGTSLEVLRYCATYEYSMKKTDCLQSKARDMMSAEYEPTLSNRLNL